MSLLRGVRQHLLLGERRSEDVFSKYIVNRYGMRGRLNVLRVEFPELLKVLEQLVQLLAECLGFFVRESQTREERNP
jgi:hypothetical protein